MTKSRRVPSRTSRRLPIGTDLAILGGLFLVLGGALLYVLLLPPPGASFSLDRVPAQAALAGFYGVEENAQGAFRWSKPEAMIAVPVGAPGRYRVVVALQDSPTNPSSRQVTLTSGDSTATFPVEAALRSYAFDVRLDPRVWAIAPDQGLTIALRTTPYLPAGDQRALGMIVSRVEVAPLGATAPDWSILLPILAVATLAGTLFGATRSRRALVIFVGTVALVVGSVAVLARPLALLLLYLPSSRPGAFVLALVGVMALALLAVAVARAVPPGADSAGMTALPTWERYGRIATLPLLLAVAGALRFGGLDTLSLWLDEGATVHFAALSWTRALGLEGRYDLHPPLYYALVKLITPLASPALAGRFVSAAAGTLTVGVVYLLGASLLNWRVGAAAGFLLAVSPIHIWYSQEGRMYALAVFFVALAAFALVGFARAASRGAASFGWSALFGLATVLAAYTVYSAFYTLIPLAVAILWLIARHRWRALPLVIASGLAALLYLPWVPQLLQTTATVGGDAAMLQGREGLLAANGESVGGSLLTIGGFGGTLGVMANSQPLFWSRWPTFHYPLLLLLLAAVVVGIVIACRRSSLAAIIGAASLIGTVVVGILISMISPGYADRTVLAATIGWALLVGCLAFAARPRWLGLFSLIAYAIIIGLSLQSLLIVRATAWKQPYRDVIADAARVATLGVPIAPLSSWMPSFVAAYAPNLPTVALLDPGGRIRPVSAGAGDTGAIWLIYADNPWDNVESARRQLAAQGYERRLHKFYRRLLYLDLYARPDARLGATVALPEPFSDQGAVRWQRPASGAEMAGDGAARTLTLTNTAKGERVASLDVPLSSAGVVSLEVEAQSGVPGSQLGASLLCLAATGSPVELESNEGMQSFPAGGSWHLVRTATLCPAGTATVRIALRNSGVGAASFRGVRLYNAPLTDARNAANEP